VKEKPSENLIDEAHKNLGEDRKAIKDFLDLIQKAASVGEGIDPLAKIALSEAFARLSGELNKNNSLVVELAKLKAKKEFLKNPHSAFSSDETDTMFDEIENPSVSDEDDSN
jgi:hypothetical protein